MIAFNTIPNNLRIPFVGVEIDNSNAITGPALLQYTGLIIANKRAGGTAAANSITQITSEDAAGVLADRKSAAFAMAKSWFAQNKSTPLYLGLVSDDGAGVAATCTITVTGPSTKAGTIALYYGDKRIPVGVSSGQAATAIATAIAAALTAEPDIELESATPSSAVVTLVYAHKGEFGNGFPVHHSYQIGEELPAGVGLTITPMAGGTGNPALTSMIANMAPHWFNVIAHPYTDATNLTAIETEMASRFSGTRMVDGIAITSNPGSFASLTSLGQSRNSPHSLIMAQPGPGAGICSPAHKFAAAVAGCMAFHGAIDPARPFQTLPLVGISQPRTAFDDISERNLLLFNGIGTTKNGAGGVVQMDRPITTYRKNAAGADDVSYLDSNTMLNLMYLRYSFRQKMMLRYPRHKLADNGTRIPAGQYIATPAGIKSTAIEWFDDMVELGLTENKKLFVDNLVVERNADRNRVDIVLPPDIINQLMVVAAGIRFRL